MASEQNNTTVTLMPNGTIGGGLGFGYASLCLAFAANAFGFCNADGFTIGIGVVLLGFFVVYMVGGVHFVLQGSTMLGSIYIAFAIAFGLYGGAVNIAGTVCAANGLPCDFTIAGLANVIAGAYLLILLPAMAGYSKNDFICFLFSGIGVVAFGLATLGVAGAGYVGGAAIFVAAVTAYYGSVATCYASVGKELPLGKPFF